MKTENKEVYSCDFCNKRYFHKGYARKHETMCNKNPKNERPCFGCRFLEKKAFLEYYDTGWGEQTRNLSIFHCSSKKIYLHTPQNVIKKNYVEESDPMPKQCDVYENDSFNMENFNFDTF